MLWLRSISKQWHERWFLLELNTRLSFYSPHEKKRWNEEVKYRLSVRRLSCSGWWTSQSGWSVCCLCCWSWRKVKESLRALKKVRSWRHWRSLCSSWTVGLGFWSWSPPSLLGSGGAGRRLQILSVCRLLSASPPHSAPSGGAEPTDGPPPPAAAVVCSAPSPTQTFSAGTTLSPLERRMMKEGSDTLVWQPPSPLWCPEHSSSSWWTLMKVLRFQPPDSLKSDPPQSPGDGLDAPSERGCSP